MRGEQAEGGRGAVFEEGIGSGVALSVPSEKAVFEVSNRSEVFILCKIPQQSHPNKWSLLFAHVRSIL